MQARLACIRWSSASDGSLRTYRSQQPATLSSSFSPVVGHDQPCFIEFVQEITSVAGENFQSPFFVRLDFCHFQDNLSQLRSPSIGRLGQLAKPRYILVRDVGLAKVVEDFTFVLHGLPFFLRHPRTYLADVCPVPLAREGFVCHARSADPAVVPLLLLCHLSPGRTEEITWNGELTIPCEERRKPCSRACHCSVSCVLLSATFRRMSISKHSILACALSDWLTTRR